MRAFSLLTSKLQGNRCSSTKITITGIFSPTSSQLSEVMNKLIDIRITNVRNTKEDKPAVETRLYCQTVKNVLGINSN